MSTQHRAPPRNGAPRRPTWLLATMLVMTAGPLAPTAARAQAGPQPQVSGAPDVRGTVQSFDDERLPPVTVTATRDARRLLETPAAVGIVSGRTIRDTAPAHPQQLLGQVPGVAVAVTNGEGHTTAIRQGFTTAPLYLFLEDGLPIRATGFFNHNALYEINLPMAGRVEVIRGPGSALYGSDAIGGIVNVLTGAPAAQAGIRAHAEAGSFGWRRLLAQADSGEGQYGALRADLNLTRTDGWRERTAYDRSGGTLRWDAADVAGGQARTVLAFSRIDQQTGANSPLPEADYRSDPRRNNFPIAYRKVDALRLSSAWSRGLGEGTLTVTPYLRDNAMELLASFSLASDPNLTITQNQSWGVTSQWRRDWAGPGRARLIAGLDLEWSPGSHRENRLAVTTTGAGASRVYTAYTVGTRIFDYKVDFRTISPYLHAEYSPLPALRVVAGLRHDRLDYSSRNNLGPAPILDPASGRWYGQAADSAVAFERLSPKLGATWALAPRVSAWAAWNHGFRVPSQSQLFRPAVAASPTEAQQRADLALGLRPIRAEQAEVGLRGRLGAMDFELAAFDLVKRDDLVSQRDPATNLSVPVNAGRTRHRGVELGLGVRLSPTVRLDAALSHATHRYAQWQTASADFSGREIEAAPRSLGNLRLGWAPRPGALVQLEWVHLGAYWLEASNASAWPRYPGHNLVNARLAWPVTPSVSVFARVLNLADRRYADSASVSSNTAVYSPGLPRSAYVGAEVRW
jgi:outer membrane receptor protein involved in Fe transport